MMKNKLNLILLAVLMMALLVGACTDKNAVEANKFVDSANKKLQESKDMIVKMPTAKSVGEWIDETKDIAEVQKAHEAEVKDILKNWDDIIAKEKSAASDFREAGKLNSDQAFKSYYEALAKQMDIQVDKGNATKEIFQAFLDIKNWDAFGEKAGSFKAKMLDLQKQDTDNTAQITKLEAGLPNAKK